MAHEPEEVIKHQMLETRASLTEKLETLEQQVVGTVQNATSAVTDTVETVKDAVQQTMEMAKTSVKDTVDAVKDSLDLPRHVREHPWLMLGGSVAAGYLGGYLLSRAESRGYRGGMAGIPSLSTLSSQAGPDRNGGVRSSSEEAAPARAAGSTSQGLLGELGQKFESELHQLKGLALGAMLGVARDMIMNSAPPQVASQLAEIVDSATVKLGGQPIHGPVLKAFQQADTGQRSHWTEEERPLGVAPRQGAAAYPVD